MSLLLHGKAAMVAADGDPHGLILLLRSTACRNDGRHSLQIEFGDALGQLGFDLLGALLVEFRPARRSGRQCRRLIAAQHASCAPRPRAIG